MPSGGYRPRAGRSRKNAIDKKLEGRPTNTGPPKPLPKRVSTKNVMLMDGRKAYLVLTDSPYNVAFESASGLKIKNDSIKADQSYEFLLSAFRNLAESLEGGGSAYIFCH